MAEDIHRWAARQGLSEDVVQVLLDQDFTTVDDLKELSPDDLVDIFQKPQLLKGKQFLALKKAIATLPQTTSPDDVESPSSSSQSHGRGRSDFVSSELRRPSVDSNDEPQEITPPKKAKFSQSPGSTRSNRATTAQASAPAPRGWFGALKDKATGLLKDRLFGSPDNETFRLLMLGKTGSGKSTTGNTILGEEKFKAGMMFSSVTSECDLQRVEKNGRLVELMDCPGLYDTEKTQEEVATTIVQAVACMHPGPHAILYVIRVGRYTAEEFGVFNRLKALFDERITDYMIILFTGGDDMKRANATLADLMKNAPKELTQAVDECGHRCHVFDNTASDKKPQVDKLLDEVRKMKSAKEDQPYYDCPKYATIGDGLEKEVERRLAEVTKKDLKRQQYVRELEMQIKEKEEGVKTLKAENRRKEAERKRQLKQEEKKRKQKEGRLLQELKAKEHELSEEKKKQKEGEIQALKTQFEELLSRMDNQRQEDQRRMGERERERQKLENQRLQAEREDAERRERAYREEAHRMKQGIARREEPGFFDRAGRVVGDVITAPLKCLSKVGSWLFG